MNNFTQKAQEVSHAIIRVASYIRRKDLRQRMESLSFDLLESIHKKDYDHVLLVIDSLSGFLKLGTSLYEIETLNSRVILGELSLLNANIRQLFGLDKISDMSVLFPSTTKVNIENDGDKAMSLINLDEKKAEYELANMKLSDIDDAAILMRQSAINKVNSANTANESEQIGNEEIANAAIDAESNSDSEFDKKSFNFNKVDAGMVSIGSAIRQNSILERIKTMSKKDESGYILGCRMKDLMAAFPNVSERTLRYDLQKLLGRGLVERLGNGGPSSVYVIK